MTTARFNRLASPTAQAMGKAHDLVLEGQRLGRFTCTAPRCSGTIEFTGDLRQPHRTAGKCNSPGCIRWAAQ
jgi:hypothetical protein